MLPPSVGMPALVTRAMHDRRQLRLLAQDGSKSDAHLQVNVFFVYFIMEMRKKSYQAIRVAPPWPLSIFALVVLKRTECRETCDRRKVILLFFQADVFTARAMSSHGIWVIFVEHNQLWRFTADPAGFLQCTTHVFFVFGWSH